MWLIAPEAIDDDFVENILPQAKTVRIFLSRYDEDCRGIFWTEKTAFAKREKIEILTLEGIGTQAEWAWNAVVGQI